MKFTIYNSQRGFTLIEIVTAMAVLVIMVSLGLFVSFDFYKSYAFRSEKNSIVSILQKARNESLNNIDQVKHGVHFGNPLTYIIFQCKIPPAPCTSYADADSSKDNIIDPSYGISISGAPFDVIFDQLGGASIDKTITVSYGTTSYHITINSEGQIDTP